MQLYNDDCFNILPTLNDNSVDCVIVDTPYSKPNYSNVACEWNDAIDLEKMWQELKRICKPNANFIFFCNTKFGYELIKSNPKWFRYDWVWKKNKKVGFLTCKKLPLRQHEMIYVFGNPSYGFKTYNPQRVKGKPIYNSGKCGTSLYAPRGSKVNVPNVSHARYPTTILTYKNPSKSLHQTQKPLELCEYLVKTYSKKHDVILDFTMGSGTTGVACKHLDRKFVWIEKDLSIYTIACKRLKEVE